MDPEAYRRRRAPRGRLDRRLSSRRRTLPCAQSRAAGDGASRTPAGAAGARRTDRRRARRHRGLLIPATTHWQSPGFMAYFASSGSGPGILGETLAAALNVNAMLWRTAPAATELEQVTLDWLRQMVGLPQPMFGVINDTASSSTLYALAAAREAQTDLRIRELGMAGRPDLPRLALLRLDRGALIRREGRHRPWYRQGRAALDPGRRTISHGPGRAAPGDSRGCRRGRSALRGCCHRRDHLDDQRRPGPGHRGTLRTARLVAPRRRGLRRRGGDRAGAALGSRRRRAGRLDRRQPAQVALHANRLQRAVDATPRRASRRVLDRARVPHHR